MIVWVASPGILRVRPLAIVWPCQWHLFRANALSLPLHFLLLHWSSCFWLSLLFQFYCHGSPFLGVYMQWSVIACCEALLSISDIYRVDIALTCIARYPIPYYSTNWGSILSYTKTQTNKFLSRLINPYHLYFPQLRNPFDVKYFFKNIVAVYMDLVSAAKSTIALNTIFISFTSSCIFAAHRQKPQ